MIHLPVSAPQPTALDGLKFRAEDDVLADLVAAFAPAPEVRARISKRAAGYIARIRAETAPTLMEHFLAEYGLSTREGVALMCLAEAMLRVPDRETIDELIEDKIAPSDWGRHLGEASSSLVNASTWALMLTGRVLEDPKPGLAGTLRGAIKRLGEPVIRSAVSRAMKEMGRQFVLGQTIGDALTRARAQEAKGYTYSYDMLGEAAMTAGDAARYARAYADAMTAIAAACTHGSVRDNPGISVKLSALHPRYQVAQEDRVMAELVPVVTALARQARAANMGFNIDAEEQDRLTLSLRVIGAVLAGPELAGWDGFGVVVQAYGKRAGGVIDWLQETAEALDRKLMVRLVKGAYWDSEMKRAQVEGHPDFPLFTTKTATDVSYLCNARKLLEASRLYPQFATHNAHSVAAILEMAGDAPFEFQRLHGMGERLHDMVLKEAGSRCRIYAPVGAHRDLLAYLVRRLLENGANSSFVNQIVDTEVTPEEIARDPFDALAMARPPAGLSKPADLFAPERTNSTGFDLSDEVTLARIEAARSAAVLPAARPLIAGEASGVTVPVTNPATGAEIGTVQEADTDCVALALAGAAPWDAPVSTRAEVLRRAADLYEENFGLIFAALAREAGKTLPDAVGELREAVDFLRYYAAQAEARGETQPLGRVTAISPWNFPLAIFTGQIAAALAMGNAVLAKPAEQTPIIAAIGAELLHKAGVPVSALQLLPGQGGTVGAALTSDPRIDGVVFTGSTETAQIIRRSMAANLAPEAPLIAETGGLNAMIVDSTALPEQAVRDVVASAFQSAGQRCSALRCLYVQEDVAPHLIAMIRGAMEELRLGDPWSLATDVGPVIDTEARDQIAAYIAAARADGRLLHALTPPNQGTFVAPAMIEVPGISALEREVFGPVLHVARFAAGDLDQVIAAINARGYGLTFGLHTRIDSRVQDIADRLHIGNVYVNRNQIGAVVGSQPFGGEGLSGTGPKAGGPLYLSRFARAAMPGAMDNWGSEADPLAVQAAIFEAANAPERIVSTEDLPGPTGESNRLRTVPRAPILCLGPGPAAVVEQASAVRALGGVAVEVQGRLEATALATLEGFAGALYWGEGAAAYAQALASRPGAILPLIVTTPDAGHVLLERHLCVDTTAAGGNAALLSGGLAVG
ncbi:bifunctional proline dehydrogenase/L-glutamate gamma-semialdehyde dehydrogenase PutA [Pseudothioclava nitratireducens]|uniref:bifunctional proline dehydrogenase/L-glutamate gamma-semialdehyde dehydrogenase PutA n=1 Tax=Pseudothioclava nitratireducens TaxID=1928646 RepID=UPI0023DB13C3|nr:bifunctional proline dehydrogenase/L-glutamate gamma-semialdehyde dehydrogenase PutA [Defluviimonas nitratireducens]MDF1619020.1 bifunctional proline dehydrogenase/L-glutamate gamma-semialdehyde dehydrogenase PutA [Defluviimonas nitratireducens]